MPRFYLHLHNAEIDALDTEGREFPNLDAARLQAIAGIRDFIGHEATKGLIDFRGHMEIVNERDETVATIAFADAFTVRGI